MRFLLGACLVIALNGLAEGTAPEIPLETYTVEMLQGPEQVVAGAGIYLGGGLAITAAHVTGPNHPAVRINGQDLPATMITRGGFKGVDLAVFSLHTEQLPAATS